jgi:hypothetical protein
MKFRVPTSPLEDGFLAGNVMNSSAVLRRWTAEHGNTVGPKPGIAVLGRGGTK